MRRMTNRIKDQLQKRKKGITSLEAVIGTLIFLMVFVAVLDALTLYNKNSALSETGKELARTLSVQGGALDSKPAGYASNYYTIDQLAGFVNDNMKIAGFDGGDWQVSIRYTKIYDETANHSVDYTGTQRIIWGEAGQLTGCSATEKIDYLSNFSVIIKAKFKWKFLQAFMGDRASTISISMPGTSEWKYDYDYWDSEF